MQKHAPAWFLLTFYILFIAMGGGVIYSFGWLTFQEAEAAKSWKQVTCSITSSRVKTNRGSDSTTYSLALQYDYMVNGHGYGGKRYNFFEHSSSNYTYWKKLQEQYPVGSQHSCYVNPANPAESVINRELPTFEHMVPVALGGLFVVIGLWGIIGTFHLKRKREKLASEGKLQSWQPHISHGARHPSKGWEIRPFSSLTGKFLGITAIAIIWNALAWGGFIAFGDIEGWAKEDFSNTEWVPVLIISIFVLIGLFLIFCAFQALLSLRNPYPVLYCGEQSLHLGDDVQIRWYIKGDHTRAQAMTVTLRGEESATYRVGTKTRTSTHDFYEKELLAMNAQGAMRQGDFRLQIPTDTMHSFEGGRNEVKWQVMIHLDIPNWPDTNLEFPLLIRPHHQEAGA